jgi:hypothetical protein
MKELVLPVFLAVTYTILVALPDGFLRIKPVPTAAIRPMHMKPFIQIQNQKMNQPLMKNLKQWKSPLYDGFELDQGIGVSSTMQ